MIDYAFPDTAFHPGMTLRDWFAGQALVGLSPMLNGKDANEAARRSYQAADAMMAERAKGRP